MTSIILDTQLHNNETNKEENLYPHSLKVFKPKHKVRNYFLEII